MFILLGLFAQKLMPNAIIIFSGGVLGTKLTKELYRVKNIEISHYY